jgi:hypothetical protein
MLNILNKLVATQDDVTTTTYTVAGTVTLAGDSIWGDTQGRVVNVTAIHVITHDDSDYTAIGVEHDSEWDIYTDTGFTVAIGAVLNADVDFTEQGMQEDNYASMELC